MEPPEDPCTNTTSLSGWAFVSSQGELMQVDTDSDTSESSIEVVSVEDNDVVSFHQGRKEGTGSAKERKHQSGYLTQEVVAEEPSYEIPLEEQTGMDPENKRVVVETHEASGDITSDLNTTLVENSGGSSIEPTVDKAGQLSLFQGAEDLFPGTQKGGSIDDKIWPTDPSLPLNPLINPVSGDPELGESVQSHIPERSDETKSLHSSPENEIVPGFPDGACCKELLSDCESRNKVDDCIQENTLFFFCSDAEVRKIDKEEGEEISNPVGDNRSEASSDSDFVRLDPENMEDFGVINQEAEMAPVLLHRSRSSIDDNFRFMRAQDVSVQPPPIFDNAIGENDGFEGDIDRDDETESSTEEGIDDRIESEQSEAGSYIAVNDVGDLSAFADIGDIPLVVGDVRRNYIHRPNNHLSSVLNISLLLAAILTTGISFGIIMATDLEIEEWQNAYELQTMRVKQLESQLLEMKSLSNWLKITQADAAYKAIKYQKMERALNWLEICGIVGGGHFSHAANLVRGFFQLFIHCEDFNNSDTDSDNGSFVRTSVCNDWLQDYTVKADWAIESHKVAGIQDLGNVKGFGKDSLKDGGTGDKDDSLDIYSSQVEDTDVLLENKESHLPSSERKPYTPKKVQGQGVVDMDIRQLQHSVSREQERALHWQHLYLFERRQRERERENEEREDERDREEWEKELKNEREEMERSKADLSELECLKKILASNLTTLTQHVAKWNVSVFDDFANLSTLLSSIQDLKQSVVDSISKVWDGAEEVFERLETGSTENAESFWGKAFVLRRYLLEFIHSIRGNSELQLETLLAHLQHSLEKMKQSFETLRHNGNSDTVAYWVEHAWEVTEDIIGKLQDGVERVVPEKEVLLTYLQNLFDSLEMNYYDETTASQGNVETQGEDYEVQRQEQKGDDRIRNVADSFLKSSNDDGYEDVINDGKEEEDDDEDEEEEDDNSYNEENETQDSKDEQGWSTGILDVLSKTHRSFQQLGQKVVRTFGEIKTIWHKKDMPLIRIAKRLTSKFMRASVKLTKMCTKLPATLFKGHTDAKDGDHVLIYSKRVKKLRKQWQKQLLKNPCESAGMLSSECNSDRKTLKKELKEVSKLFSQLLKIKTFQPAEALKLSRQDAALHYELFKSFQERWGGRSMLLKKDLEWTVCQRDWWFQVLQAQKKPNGEGNELTLNSCDIFSTHESFFPGGSIEEIDKLKTKKVKQNSKRNHNVRKDGRDDKDKEKPTNNKSFHHQPTKDQEHQVNKSKAAVIADDESSSKSFNERARYHLQHRSLKEENLDKDRSGESPKQRHMPESLASKQNKRYLMDNLDQRKNDWFLKKAQHREHQREEHSKSEWLFERARQRRQNTWHKRNGEHSKIYRDKKRYSKEENWALKHGHYRQEQREEEHRADWVFDRAADRKEHHDSALLDCIHAKGSKKEKYYDKEFRCAYGKVSLP